MLSSEIYEKAEFNKLKNLKLKLLWEAFNRKQLLALGNQTFKVDSNFLCLIQCSFLLKLENIELIDIYNVPGSLTLDKAFVEIILDFYTKSLNWYHSSYKKIQESLTIEELNEDVLWDSYG